MKRKLFGMMMAICMLITLFSMSPLCVSAASEPQITVSNGVLSADWTHYEVTVSVANNPGITVMRLKLNYDTNNLKLVGVTDGNLLGDNIHTDNLGAKSYYLYWNNSLATSNYTANGVIATLKFEVIGQTGNYPVSVSAGYGDIIDCYEEAVSFSMVAGTVAACTHDNVSTQVVQPGSCTVNKEVMVTCDHCRASKTEITTAAGHRWSEWNEVPATLKKDGYRDRHCLDCNEPQHEVLPKLTADGPYVELSDETAGTRQVQVKLNMYNNTGIAAMKWRVSYNADEMTMVQCLNEGLFSEAYVDDNMIAFENDTDVTGNGILAVLVFELSDNAPDTVSYTLEPVDGSVKKADGTPVSCDAVGGEITIPDEIRHTVTIQNATGGTVDIDRQTYYYGDRITLTATPHTGNDFRFWIVGNRSYTQSVLTLTVTGNLVVQPTFVQNDAEQTVYTIRFLTADGRLVATKLSTELVDESDLPDVPLRYGYTCVGWDVVELDFDADADIYPTYIKDESIEYQITVNGVALKAEGFRYEDRVRVTATDPAFAAWVDANEYVIAFAQEYTFHATQSIDLFERSEGEVEVTDYAISINYKTNNIATGTKYRMSVVAETHIDEDVYTLVERGILYTTADVTDAGEIFVGADGVKQKVATASHKSQFIYTLNNVPRGTKVTIRAYMLLKDCTGEVFYWYSDGLCDGTWALPEPDPDDSFIEDEDDF